MTRLTYGSLFTGVGGMDMGFDMHMDCVFQVEWDKHCQSILRRHWPEVPKWSDVCDVDGALLPPCDILTFGSPCQDLSVAGKRNGLNGERSSMFYQATRIIKEMRNATASRPTGPLPRAVVWENVPGALSSNNGHDFRAVLDTLADIGSHLTEWAILDAQHYGVPQRRRRIFLVAIIDPTIASRCPDPLLPVTEGRRRDFAKGQQKGQGVAGSVATSVGATSTHRKLGHGHYVEDDTASALKQRDYKDATDLAVVPIIFDGTRHDDFRMDTEIVPTLKQRMGTGGGQVPMVFEPGAIGRLGGDRFSTEVSHTLRANMGDNTPAIVYPITAAFKPMQGEKAFGIGYGEEIAPTLEAGGGGNTPPAIIYPITQPHIAQPIGFSHTQNLDPQASETAWPTLRSGGGGHAVLTEYAVRRLTPLECERLMGWPDDHTRWTDEGKEQADTHRYKQCGNGVATPVARWVAHHLNQLITGDHT